MPRRRSKSPHGARSRICKARIIQAHEEAGHELKRRFRGDIFTINGWPRLQAPDEIPSPRTRSIIKGSLEGGVLKIAEGKGEMIAAVTEGGSGSVSDLGMEDIETLFTPSDALRDRAG